MKKFFSTSLVLAALCVVCPASLAENKDQAELFNASYDVTRAFFKKYNRLFQKHYSELHPGAALKIYQSHDSSTKQANSIIHGLPADVVSLNQASDLLPLVSKGFVSKDWQQHFPNKAVPFESVVVILVRRGNPKNIHDWRDLARPGIQYVMANPKSSGTGRYSFLALYGGLRQAYADNPAETEHALSAAVGNIVIRANGGHGATNAFISGQIGDAVITLENEAQMAANYYSPGDFEVIYPDYTIKVQSPVAVVEPIAARNGVSELAHEYVRYLFSKPAQDLAASMYLRPTRQDAAQQSGSRVPAVHAHDPNEEFGSWAHIQKVIFTDGAFFDKLSDVAAQSASR